MTEINFTTKGLLLKAVCGQNYEITAMYRLIHNCDDGHYGLRNEWTVPENSYVKKQEGFIEFDLKMPSIYEFKLNLEAKCNPRDAYSFPSWFPGSNGDAHAKMTLGYSYNVQSGDVSFEALIPKVYQLEGKMKKQKINISSKTLLVNTPSHVSTDMLNWKFVGENDGFKKMDYELNLEGKK